MARYLLIQKGDNEVYLIRDNGHRIHLKIIETKSVNMDEYKKDWLHIAEYKHCDVLKYAMTVINLLFPKDDLDGE